VPDAISTGLLDVPPDRAEALRGQAERYGLASLTRAADIVATGLDQMRGATSPRLLLELMCAQVLLPAAATDERSLLARLERLEAGAATARAGTAPAPVQVPAAASDVYPERVRPAPQPTPSPDGGAKRGAEQPAPSAEQPGSAHPDRPEAQPAAQPPETTQPARQPGAYGQAGGAQRQAPVPSPAPAFTHAPGAPGTPSAPAAPRGTVTIDALRQAWPNVIEAIRAKSRVAWIVIRNASAASFDEGVLTLRFPRQGDVKGFQGTKYEDLLKQELNAMFGVNVVIRAITGGGDAPSPGRRPGPAPGPLPAARSLHGARVRAAGRTAAAAGTRQRRRPGRPADRPSG
jgi:DNA polymerase-3 subunit gamma/tau